MPDLLPIVVPRSPTLKAVTVVAMAGLAMASAARGEVDPIVMFDGFDGCAPVQREIGPAGGSLRLCGAELVVPPDALAAPMTFGIERLAEPGAAPFDMEFAGPAFRFTPNDPGLQAPASVRVPRDDARTGGLAYRGVNEARYLLIEACGVSEGGLQQYSGALGDFAAVRYVGDLPPNTQGLGDGTIHTLTGTVAADFDIDAPGNNHAIYQDQEDGRRLVTIVSMLEGDQFEYVRFDLVVDFAAGDGELVQISRLGSIGGSYIVGLIGSASITFGDLADGRIRATIDATLESGPEQIPFHATIDAAAERFIFPPSLQCPGGDFPPEG